MGEGVEITGQKRPVRLWIRRLLIVVSCIGALLAVVVPAIQSARESARRMQSSNHLKQISLALVNYHDTFQSFPAAWQVDGRGKVAHSWRVALWPFLSCSSDSDRYRYSEPWNGPNNSELARSSSDFLYRGPSDHRQRSGMTSYVAVVGPGTMWPGTGYSSMSDLKDGASNTVMLVEIADSDIHWMEPRDLPIEELAEWLKPTHKPSLGTSQRGKITGAIVAFADGRTEYFSRGKLTEKRLRALLSPAGNDTADAEE